MDFNACLVFRINSMQFPGCVSFFICNKSQREWVEKTLSKKTNVPSKIWLKSDFSQRVCISTSVLTTSIQTMKYRISCDSADMAVIVSPVKSSLSSFVSVCVFYLASLVPSLAWVSVKCRVIKMNEVNIKIGQSSDLVWSIPLWYWIRVYVWAMHFYLT